MRTNQYSQYVNYYYFLNRCEQFRTQRMQSLDRFKVEEDRSQEELEEEEALAKRLKLAFKAAKVAAAKRREQRAK